MTSLTEKMIIQRRNEKKGKVIKDDKMAKFINIINCFIYNFNILNCKIA